MAAAPGAAWSPAGSGRPGSGAAWSPTPGREGRDGPAAGWVAPAGLTEDDGPEEPLGTRAAAGVIAAAPTSAALTATVPSWLAVVVIRVVVLWPSSGRPATHAVGPIAQSSRLLGMATIARTTDGSNWEPAQRTSSRSAASLRTGRW